jgi:hypothetical protein
MPGSFALRSADLAWREVDGQVVILDLRTSDFLELNRAGSVLWLRMAESPTTVADLTAQLVLAYGIAEDEANLDAKAFVEALCEADLIEP